MFRDRLEKAGMLEQAGDFFKASGAWSVELYRADIEMNLRSKRMAGFQLLDLQDYPASTSGIYHHSARMAIQLYHATFEQSRRCR